MQKKIFHLLMKADRSTVENQQLEQYMSQRFFKSMITPLPIKILIQKIQVQQWPYQSIIFNEGQKIDSYYFLLEGSVNLYKKIHSSEQNDSKLQLTKNIDKSSMVSDSFFSHAALRAHTAIATDSSATCKGFILQKKEFQLHCANLIKEYKILKSYFCNFLNLSSDRFYKTDLYQNIGFKNLYYGQEVNVKGNIFIIFQGQCEMSFSEKPSKIRKTHHDSLKANTGKSQNYRPLLKLCQNQCFGIQNAFNSKLSKCYPYQFKYVVTSEKIVFITIQTSKLQCFPHQINQKLNLIHQSHMLKLKNNMSFINMRKILIDQESGIVPSHSLSPIFKNCQLIQRNQKCLTLNNNLEESIVKSTYFQIQGVKGLSSIYKKDSVRYKLPNLRTKKRILNQVQEQSRLNKTQNLSPPHSPSKNSKITNDNIIQLRNKFCLGFDLKNKCQKQSLHFEKHKISQNIIKQPKGYFPFTKNRKRDKQNSPSNYQNTQRNGNKSKQKQWSYYIKLPRLC